MDCVKIEAGKALPGGTLYRAPAHIVIEQPGERISKTIQQEIADYVCAEAESKRAVPSMDQLVEIAARFHAESAFRAICGMYGMEKSRPDARREIAAICGSMAFEQLHEKAVRVKGLDPLAPVPIHGNNKKPKKSVEK